MRCANCGTENPEASKFCGNCGQALETAAETETIEAATEDTAVQEVAAPTEQHAAYEAALAAINKPSTDVPATAEPPVGPPVAAPVAPTGPVTHQQPVETAPPPQAATLGAPVATAPPDGPNRKVMIGVIVGSVAGLAILAAIYFLFLRNDDSEPVRSDVSTIDEAPETEGADAEAPEDELPAFDSIEPLIAESAGPYTLTQTSSEPCTPPCIFPDTAHPGSSETMQVTYDAGTPESSIYGEFLLYGAVADAQLAMEATAADLEARGYEAMGSFEISGITGTAYQSVEDEVLLWSSSNLLMGLAGSKGYPTELVGYLGS